MKSDERPRKMQHSQDSDHSAHGGKVRRITWAHYGKTLSRIGFAAGILACIPGVIALCITVLRGQFSFDEFLHLHFLWLISAGRIPHVDFWCNYPALGYAILLPFFRLLPESFYSVLVLRFLDLLILSGVCIILILHARKLRVNWIWGVLPIILFFPNRLSPWVMEFRTDALAAVLAASALALMLRNPRPVLGGLATGLAALSLLIMPKYLYPLGLSIIAYAIHGCCTVKPRLPFIRALAIGGVSGIVAAQILLLTIHVTLWDDFRWSWILMQAFYDHLSKTETSLPLLIVAAAHYFSDNWWNAILSVAGIFGLVAVEWKNRGVPLFVGAGLLAGVILSWIIGVLPFNQYLVPGLLCLALLVPYAPRLINKPFWPVITGILLVCITMVTGIKAVKSGASELGTGESIGILSESDYFLHLIPPDERVVGLWPTHPCFREDQTFLTYDERWGNPKGFLPILPENSVARQCFKPGSLTASMEKSPPAALAFNTGDNYPQGWNEEIAGFLQNHATSYRQFDLLGNKVFIRNDLVK